MRLALALLLTSLLIVGFSTGYGSDSGDPSGKGGISLPFSHLYGRWVDGHYLAGYGQFQDEYEPQRWADYRWESQTYSLRASDINGYLFSHDDDDELSLPLLTFLVRPHSNWQVGVDRIVYSEKRMEFSFSSPYPNNQQIESSSTEVGLSSHWFNDEVLTVPRGREGYFYFIRPSVGRGSLVVDNELDLQRDRSLNRQHTDYYLGQSDADNKYWRLDNSIQWGVSSSAELLGNLWVRRRLSDNGSTAASVRSFQYPAKQYRSSRSYWDVSYTLQLTRHFARLFHLEGALNQRFSESESTIEEYTIHLVDSSLVSTVFDVEEHRDTRVTSLKLAAHLLTTGEFDPMVLLDDYIPRSGGIQRIPPREVPLGNLESERFYRGLLFHRQIMTTCQLQYQHTDLFANGSQNEWIFQLNAAMGLYNHLELGLDYQYSLDNRASRRGSKYYSASTQGRLAVRYRSYAHQRGQGPGWTRDSNEDIVFGLYPEAGQLYFSISYTPPVYRRVQPESIGFLTFSDLESDETSYVDMDLALGFGKTIMLQATNSEQYVESRINYRSFAGQLSGRPLPNLELSLSYSQQYYRQLRFESDGASEFSDPIFLLAVRVLI